MNFENENFDSYSHSSDSDFVSGKSENRLMFIDYDTNGEWALGVMNSTNKEVVQVITTHQNIHTLARFAINGLGVSPDKLWLSPCAATIALLSEVTKV